MEFRCDKCSYSAPENYRVKAHKKIHSNIRPLICKFPGCDFRTKHPEALTNHQRRHEKKLEFRKPFPCTFAGCKYRAALSGRLEAHMKAVHTPKRRRNFQCPLCPRKFYAKKDQLTHIPCHTNEKAFQCNLCKYKTVHESYLPVHVKRMHEESANVKCDFPGCNYSAKQRASVLVHRQTHNLDPLLRLPFACTFPNCNYRAKTNAVLKSHCRSRHRSGRSRDMPCPLCQEAFFSQVELRSHIAFRHTCEKLYRCNKCVYKTVSGSNLNRHYRSVHEKREPSEKRFKCEFCKYCTDVKSHLDRHGKAVHSDPADFQCNHSGCNYKTNVSYVFKMHVLVHEKNPEKGFPVQCTFPGCDFRRRTRAEIKTHERRHQASHIQLECELCPRKFPDGISWCFHKRLAHKTETFKCHVCKYSTCLDKGMGMHVSTQHDPLRRKGKGADGMRSSMLGKVPVVTLERICLEMV